MMETLKEARAFLKQGYQDGVKCPCCEQWVKLYRRKITPSAARTLIEAYACAPDKFDVRRLDSYDGGGDFAKLRYWKLIAEEPDGQWSITALGRSFVRRGLTVNKYAFVVNSHLLNFGGPQVDIVSCLRGKFDYNELINTNAT